MQNIKLVYFGGTDLSMNQLYRTLYKRLTETYKEYFDKNFVSMDLQTDNEGKLIIIIEAHNDQKAMEEFLTGLKSTASKRDRAILRAMGIKTKVLIDDKEDGSDGLFGVRFFDRFRRGAKEQRP